MHKIGCVVVLHEGRIVSFRMNSWIRQESAAGELADKYYKPYGRLACEVKVELFDSEEEDKNCWGEETNQKAEDWRRQWPVDPYYQKLIDEKKAFPPY